MRKSTLWVIITLMTIGMVGLISFQVYWINNAIKVHEQRFNQDVHEALNLVSQQLERREVYYAATNTFNFSNSWAINSNFDSMMFGHRSLSDWDPIKIKETQLQNKGIWQSTVEIEDSFNVGNQHITISYKINDRVIQNPDISVDNNIVTKYNDRYTAQVDSFAFINRELKRNLEKVAEKSHMVTIVLDELMNPKRSFTGRVNQKELEGLLDEALASRGIDLDYEYLVYNNQGRNVYFTNYTKTNKDDLFKSKMAVNLFPNDLMGPPAFLSITFPDEFGFLMKQIWFTLSSSLFLVVLIVFSFGYAVFTIIRQKNLSEMKNDFINNMTHELKTPISTVSLACEALQDQGIARNESFFNKYVQVIRDENDRLGRQVEKVLQMARLEKKDIKLKLEKLDLHDIIERAKENIKLQVEKRGGVIQCDLHASRTRMNTDEVHMTNILNNLLDNANKYSSENPEITIRTENAGMGIKIIISDKGIGMSKEALKKIFDKFYRVTTGNLHDVKGFGLGLAYVKTIVIALGGDINVSSIPNKGSRFEIYFPQDNG